jgi:DNA mismatch endonuclease, patch repair protein
VIRLSVKIRELQKYAKLRESGRSKVVAYERTGAIDAHRTYIMSRVKQKDTVIEVLLRSKLHKLRFRFRKNYNRLPGRPDIVLPKHRAALFVNGCFWHGHDCIKGKRPSTRTDYWLPKIEDNKERDSRKIAELIAMRWRVAVVWQCSLENSSKCENMLLQLAKWLRQDDHNPEIIEF